jgi:hypothetical protein
MLSTSMFAGTYSVFLGNQVTDGNNYYTNVDSRNFGFGRYSFHTILNLNKTECEVYNDNLHYINSLIFWIRKSNGKIRYYTGPIQIDEE